MQHLQPHAAQLGEIWGVVMDVPISSKFLLKGSAFDAFNVI